MQKIEDVVDQSNPALAIARSLSAKSSAIYRPQCRMIRLEISGLNGDLREGGNDARIFVAPIESSPRHQLRSPAFDTHGHAEAIEFDLMEPFRS